MNRQPYLIESDITGMINQSMFDKIMVLSVILAIIVVMLLCVQMYISIPAFFIAELFTKLYTGRFMIFVSYERKYSNIIHNNNV